MTTFTYLLTYSRKHFFPLTPHYSAWYRQYNRNNLPKVVTQQRNDRKSSEAGVIFRKGQAGQLNWGLCSTGPHIFHDMILL